MKFIVYLYIYVKGWNSSYIHVLLEKYSCHVGYLLGSIHVQVQKYHALLEFSYLTHAVIKCEVANHLNSLTYLLEVSFRL